LEQIIIKTPQEVEYMRKIGKLHAEVLSRTKAFIKAGQTPSEIDNFAYEICKELGITAAQIGYKGYPYATCIGVNDDGVHCFPSKDKILKDGDIVTFDTVTKLNDWHADGGFSVGIGEVDSEGKRLLRTGKKALKAAIKSIKPGREVKDISKAIYKVAIKAGFNPIQRFAGHGLGKDIHEAPSIPNYPWEGKSQKLEPGMVLALDTMICEGSSEVKFLKDGWSTKMADGKRFVFFEHTVAITKNGVEVLTA